MENLSREELRIGNYIFGSIYVDTEDAKDDLEKHYREETEWQITEVEGIPHEYDEYAVWVDDEYYRLKPLPLKDYHFSQFEEFHFFKDNQGGWVVDLFTNYLELMPAPEGWYPVYAEYSEVSSEPEQRIHLKCIKYVHELQNLFYILEGKDLKFKSY